MERGDEVPVDEEVPEGRCGERRPEASERRHGDDEQQVQEHHRRDAEVAAELGERPGQDRQADRGEAEAEEHAPAG